MVDQKPSLLTRIKESGGFIILLTVFGAFCYTLDIFLDVLSIQRSISSCDNYTIVSTQKIQEKTIGYFMIGVFFLSVSVVGFDAILKGSGLILVKNHKSIFILMVIACLMNLGPVFFILVGYFIKTGHFRRFYASDKEMEHDQQLVEQALSSTKTKEAVFENGPMLVIMCFKVAMTSKFVLLDQISGISSAILLARTILSYINEKKISPPGFLKTMIGSLFLGVFMYLTTFNICTFATESERAGLLIPLDPTREDSAGLVYLLLIFPTLLFVLIPFTIYDLVPFLLNKSFIVWEQFQTPPKIIWYLSTLLCCLALSFNLSTSWYLLRRDPISFTTDVNFKFNIRPSQIFPAVLSNQYYLNMGAGRIYFKVFPILTIATSLVAFLICTVYILGMRYWDRQEYRDILKEIAVQELPEIVKKIKEEEDTLQIPFENCRALPSLFEQIHQEEEGEEMSNSIKS